MRRNENFILRRVADMSVIVPLGAAAEAFPGMISVNETGAFLWDLLEQEQTLQSLGDALMRRVFGRTGAGGGRRSRLS